ncbi:MAG: energy-coupling factor ABC transporter ATP-binding protein [bacterium]
MENRSTVDPQLILEGVSFSYDGAFPLFQDLYFRLKVGELVVIWGANGVGKSTLARIISGLVQPTKGSINIEGIPPGNFPVGLVMENPHHQFLSPNVQEEIALGLRAQGYPSKVIKEKVDEVLQTFGLEPLRHLTPENLSEGELLLVILASVVAMKPSFLILDEIFTYLHPQERERIWREVVRCSQTMGILILTARWLPLYQGLPLFQMKNQRIEKLDPSELEYWG